MRLLIVIVILIQVVFPLIRMFSKVTPEAAKQVFRSEQFLPMLRNSLVSTTLATIVSVTIAFLMAWLIYRTNIRHKTTLSVIMTIPMLVPSIAHGMGLTILLGDNGFLTNLTGINIHLFGLTGIIIGSTLYAFPAAFLMFSNAFQYEDYTAYEAGQVLGLTKWQQFCGITMANFKKPLISAVATTFTTIFTDYGVPLAVGGKMVTLPVFMYREVVGLLEYSTGGILGLLLLVPAIIAFIVDLANKEESTSGVVAKPYIIQENRARDRIAVICCTVMSILIVIPIFTFLILTFINRYPVDLSLTFNNIRQSLGYGIVGFLLNSLFISLAAALAGTAASYITAYFTARSGKHFSSQMLHLISLLSLSVPGMVLGLAYVVAFHGSFIYGTFLILIMVNVTHFWGSPYLMAYNSFLKYDKNIEDVSKSLGIGGLSLLKDVYFPSMYGTILQMFEYIFVNSMVTISAVSFLANFKNKPLALLIPQFDSQAAFGSIAFVAIIILSVNVLAKLAIHFIKQHFIKKGEI